MRPEAATVQAFLARAARRLAWLSAARGAAIGFAMACLVSLAMHATRAAPVTIGALGASIAVAFAIITVVITRGERRDVARTVERRAPSSRNVIFTANELGADAEAARGYVPTLVFREAARVAGTLKPAELFPAGRAAASLAGAFALWLVLTARPVVPLPAAIENAVGRANGPPTIDEVDITITPPAYTGRKAQVLRDPSRIEALAGSRIALTVRSTAAHLAIETLASKDSLTRAKQGFVGTVAADADGYVALQPSTGPQTGGRRLIGLTVLPDLAPRVKITAPGRDQRFPDGKRTLDISIDASDDIALGSLKLRYTKVSGSGERFTFTEGEVPISIAQKDERTWTGRASWKLDPLELGPGDMVVYRAVAADKRAIGGITESDAFIAEVLAPGGVAAPGFAVDPEQDRYAVSQQMVILKTERLLAKRATMSAEDFASESADLAAEQRKVRAEFVFMLGGELEDAPDATASMTDLNETAEAEGESDILAGRNANAGHMALVRAIRAMSRAAASLNVTEPTTALPYEHDALTNLESAFSRTRILLRALSTRERLDLSRRLTGVLTDAVRDARPAPEPELSARVVALRRVLADVASLAGQRQLDRDASARAALLAEQVLQVDASAKALQDVAARLTAAASASDKGDDKRARAALDDASAGLVAALHRELPDAPMTTVDPAAARMNGALADALRRGNRRDDR